MFADNFACLQIANFRYTRKGIPSDFWNEKFATTKPSTICACLGCTTNLCFAALTLPHGLPNDSTPVRLPYVLSSPALKPQASKNIWPFCYAGASHIICFFPHTFS
jgi:hypothetical protein